MRGKVATTVCGLMLTTALGIPAAAQAAVTHPGPAHTTTAAGPSAAAHVVAAKNAVAAHLGSGAAPTVSCTGSAIIDEHHGTPLWSYVPGNGNVNLYFDNSGAATYFCPLATAVAGQYQFYADGTNVCLAVNASAHSIYEASAAACRGGASYTLWDLYDTSDSSYFLYSSEYFLFGPAQCIYDNTQRPVTYAECDASNQFQWLSFP